MKDVKSLVDMIMGLRYKDKDSRYDFLVVSERHHAIIQGACAEWYAEAMTDQIKLQSEIGRLQAMVTAYEAILRNSNFAMAVAPDYKSNDDVSSVPDSYNPSYELLG